MLSGLTAALSVLKAVGHVMRDTAEAASHLDYFRSNVDVHFEERVERCAQAHAQEHAQAHAKAHAKAHASTRTCCRACNWTHEVRALTRAKPSDMHAHGQTTRMHGERTWQQP